MKLNGCRIHRCFIVIISVVLTDANTNREVADMKCIYVAEDGIEFDNEYDCEMYEGELLHPDILNIEFYNECGELYKIQHHNIYDDNIYNACEKIDVHNDKEVNDLRWLAEMCGWCEFEQIESVGIWERHTDDYRNWFWVKEVIE